MRRLILAVWCASALAAACGSSNPAAPSGASGVAFRLDANSCGPVFGTSVWTFTFFLDGVQAGTANLSVGSTSPVFPAVTGTHVASARVTNTTATWNSINVQVPSSGSITVVLGC